MTPSIKTPITSEPDFAAFVGIDWADQKHAFCLQAAGQKAKESGELEQKPELIGPWVAKLRERFDGRPVAVAVEQSRGALIHALFSYDFLVIYPLHPKTVASSARPLSPAAARMILWIPSRFWRFSLSTEISLGP